jgi:hypothetical protein
MVADALVNLGCLGRGCIIGLGMNRNLDASLSCRLQPAVCVQHPLSQVFLIKQLSRTLQEERNRTMVLNVGGDITCQLRLLAARPLHRLQVPVDRHNKELQPANSETVLG